jgi:hypothetical protein
MKTRISNLDNVVLSLMRIGAVAVPLLTKGEVAQLNEEARTLSFVQRHDAPSGVIQNFSAVDQFSDSSYFITVAGVVSGMLNRAFSKYSLFPEPINFTDLSLQQYPVSAPDCHYAISPHRDSKSSINLVAVILLGGQAPFYICDGRDGENSRLIPVKVGEMILMRGHRFGEPRKVELQRPMHYVGRVTQERLTFGLRQTAPGEHIPKY